jgi:HAMP domain-containing protein
MKLETIRARLSGWRSAIQLAFSWLVSHSHVFLERLNFGIATRLVAAFVGVGVLVLAANVFVVKGVLIEKTTEITRVAPAPMPPPVALAPVKETEPIAIARPPPRRVVTSDALTLALQRHARAVKDRDTSQTEETRSEYQASATQLDEAATSFIAQATAISGKSFAKLSAGVKTYSADAEELLRLADERHAKVGQYAMLFEQIYARANASVKDAWKMFGRIVARQSLLQLSTDLDALRRDSSALETAESAAAAAPLIETEAAVVSNLKINEKSFRRSEGDQWYTAMSQDLENLVALREAIIQLNAQLASRSPDVAESAHNLAALIPTKIESPLVLAVPKAKSRAVPDPGVRTHSSTAAPASAATATATALQPVITPPPAIVETHSVTRDTPENRRKRVLVGWISAAVLMLMSIIAFGTVLSVVRPVRRLHDATLRLAKGDTSVQVQRAIVRHCPSDHRHVPGPGARNHRRRG